MGSNGTPTSTASDMSLEKTVDANSPVLMLDAIRRTQIPTVYLQLRTPLGDGSFGTTQVITLSNVTVDAYSQIGFNRVRLCLSYDSIKNMVNPLGDDGKPGPPTSAAWDFATNGPPSP